MLTDAPLSGNALTAADHAAKKSPPLDSESARAATDTIPAVRPSALPTSQHAPPSKAAGSADAATAHPASDAAAAVGSGQHQAAHDQQEDLLVTIETSDKLGATAECAVTMKLIGSRGSVTHCLEGGSAALTTAVRKGGKPPCGVTVHGAIGTLQSVELSLATNAWGAHRSLGRRF